ncbi:kinase-like protein [Cenococcum geophilum 1.58]|uniref:kinase-like protein n=1 Tax=Cenococcum geophilum 1.58 TaxID=794803 RepID=UPI00358F5BEE|nr:kinase-like protein [Cenococcum geophilum 1.58]
MEKMVEGGTKPSLSDSVASATESAQMGGRNSLYLRTQEMASRMSLPEFRRKCCFRWPSGGDIDGSNRLVLEPGQSPKLGKYLGTIGWSQRPFIAVFEVTKEYGFEDRLAAKEIRCTEDDEKRKVYQEILNLKILDHNHIIAFLGSYIQEERIGILMFPVASYNLQEFMDMVSTYNKNNYNDSLAAEHEHVRLLRIYPACLCQALKYLHEVLGIKHKNIKPENILIDRHDSVIITDFGISIRYTGFAGPIGYNLTGYTVKYGAPEVIHGQEWVEVGQDYNIDIFSLGCVLLEMANVIYGESFDHMYQTVGKPVPDGGLVVPYHECEELVRRWISHLLKKGKGEVNRTMVPCPPSYDQLGTSSVTPVQSFDREIFNIILKMMSKNPKERPSLQTVWELLDMTTSPCPRCHPSIY